MADNTTARAAQEFVPIAEVRDGIVILKDGSYRGVLLASSINFALKSEDEQTAILLQFQNFLNSLDFSVQFFVQSRKLDIRPYITLLESRLTEQQSDLMQIQVREYIEFIKNFTEGSNIMAKSFFIVIPYTPPILGGVSRSAFAFFGKKKGAGAEKKMSFEEHRTQLEQRIAVVEQGITRTGVRVALLGTEEVVELFYKMFNPGEIEKPIPLDQL